MAIEFKRMRTALKHENNNQLTKQILSLDKTNEYHDTKEKVLEWVTRNVLNKRTPYKGTYDEQKEKTIIALKRKYEKEYLRELDELKRIENANDIKFDEFYITIEWAKGSMGANQATANDSFGNTSGKTGGYGYDKESTAIARILNQHLEILQHMYFLKEVALGKNPNITNRELFGYGTGYGLFPHFEGGVGVGSHITALAKLGLKLEKVSYTKTTDTFRISEVV